jgi:hypothetical protein
VQCVDFTDDGWVVGPWRRRADVRVGIRVAHIRRPQAQHQGGAESRAHVPETGVARVLFGRFEGDVLDDDELDSMILMPTIVIGCGAMSDRDLPARLRGSHLMHYIASAIAMCRSNPSDSAIVRWRLTKSR